MTENRRFAIHPRTGWVLLCGAVAVLALAWWGWQFANAYTEREIMTSFEKEAENARDALTGRIDAYQNILYGAAALFAASQEVEREEWQRYIEGLRLGERFPGIRETGYARIELSGVREEDRSSSTPNAASGEAMNRRDMRSKKAVVTYLEPSPAKPALGIGKDLYSIKALQAALERSRDTGLVSLSGAIMLDGDGGSSASSHAGMIILAPVYRNGASRIDAEARRKALQGFIFSVVRIDRMMQAIFHGKISLPVDVALYDAKGETSGMLLFQPQREVSSRQAMARNITIEEGGHAWLMVVRSTPQFDLSRHSSIPLFILAGGTASALLLVAAVGLALHAQLHAMRLASDMTRDLKTSEERYARVVSGMQDGIWDLDVESGDTYYSPRLLEILRVNEKDFPPRFASFSALLHPEDKPAVMDAIKAHWKKRSPLDIEARVQTLEGLRYLRIKGTAVFNVEGRAVKMAGSVSDVTEHKLAVLKLQASEKHLRSLIEKAPVGIMLTTPQGTCEFVNDRWRELCSLPDEASGYEWMHSVHEEDRASVARTWRKAVQDKSSFTCEFRFSGPHGVTWVLALAAPAIDEGGSLTGYICALFDLTGLMEEKGLKA